MSARADRGPWPHTEHRLMAQVHAAADAADAKMIAAWLQSHRPTVVAPGTAAGVSEIERLFYPGPPPEPEVFRLHRLKTNRQVLKRARPRKSAVGTDPAKLEMVRRMWGEDETLEAIGDALGLAAATIQKVVRELGLPRRAPQWRRKR